MKGASSMSELVLYVLLLTTLLLSAAPAATSTAAGLTMRAELTHVDKGCGFTRRELMTRMFARSRARAASLHQRGGGGGGGGRYGAHPATVPAVPSMSEYLVHFAIGTPRPQHVALTLDTGSDIVWTQCDCVGSCFEQPLPVFDPSASSTNRQVGCGDPICGASYGYTIAGCAMKTYQCFYLGSYGDGSVTAGFMLRDTFTFKAADGKGAPVAVPGLAFGCGQYNNGIFTSNESGIAGFGRGPQSLPAQLKVGKFSYCFTDRYKEKSSPVFLGVPEDLRAHSTGPIRSTPMMQNPLIPDYYYLSLEGITVGKTRLPVDKSVFALNRDGSGGTVIDSGTSITHFPDTVLRLMEREFVAQLPLPVYKNASEFGDQLCFRRQPQAAAVTVPKLIFHLAGADMDLPPENYLPEEQDYPGVMCLQIGSAGPVGYMSLIGNFQQQNMHIVYDTDNNKLLFAPAQCDKL